MTDTSPIRPGEPLIDDQALLALAEFLHRGADPRDRTLWFVMLDERRPLPFLVPVDGLPVEPSDVLLTSMGGRWEDVLREQSADSLLFVLERPGAETVGESDRAWLAALQDEADEHDLRVCGFFLATEAGVRPLAPDDWVP
ncbi:hypothetical protein [Antribacter gilvus]|uniref:hypothetical protein n=1 Tax=Antribacter gilvus TaxID=2304675 RepID=UPI000F76D56F|nr:hypothetical protein [Antribacter gilvus]